VYLWRQPSCLPLIISASILEPPFQSSSRKSGLLADSLWLWPSIGAHHRSQGSDALSAVIATVVERGPIGGLQPLSATATIVAAAISPNDVEQGSILKHHASKLAKLDEAREFSSECSIS
jgi:hypothetical protein